MDTEKPCCSKRVSTEPNFDLEEKQPKYKIWKYDPSVMVPLKTKERWNRNKKLIESRELGDETDVRETFSNTLIENANDISQNTSNDCSSSDTDEFDKNDTTSISNCYQVDSDIEESERLFVEHPVYETNDEYINYSLSSDNVISDDESISSFNDRDTEEENNEVFAAQPLYDNSKMTVDDAIKILLDMFVKHNLSKSAFKCQLNLINQMLPSGHKMPKTVHYFFKYLEKEAPSCNTIKHFFCRNCQISIDDEVQICKYCGENNISFFYEIDIVEQIKRLFEVDRIDKLLMQISFKENVINDICDGSEYRRVNHDRGKFDLTLILYTDGISLVKSSTSHCWPLMFIIAELPPQIRYKNIIIAGVWYDKTMKPPMNLFLMPFCKKLSHNSIIHWKDSISNAINFSRIRAPLFIADAPARAQIQNILNFNGEYGCNICEIKTVALENSHGKRMIRVYPYEKELKLRNETAMECQANNVENNLNINHCMGVKGKTIISCLPGIQISTCFVPEFMHSVLLGVTKQFLNIWLNKKGDWKIRKYMQQIDNFLMNIKPSHAIVRTPRSLQFFHLFKASEFFNWLVYYSLPTLENYMKDIYFQHWMLLVISIYNLNETNIVSQQLKEAEELLDLFVKEVPLLYGDNELTYNVHQLRHLTLAVHRWGPLWSTSAFPFERIYGISYNIFDHI